MNTSSVPQMSVVIITPDTYETIRRTVEYLKEQSVKDELELVIVALSAGGFDADPGELDCFRAVRIVEPGELTSQGQAMASGVRAASAPIVAFTEDHVFPDPLWAEALIESHKSGRAAVGPVIYNANPVNAVGWADIMIGYSQWLYPNGGGEMNHLPGHNSSYKRDILLGYGEELDRLLEAESVLHWDLVSKGHKLYLEPAAKINHLNFGVFSTFLKVNLLMGRTFAAIRRESWPAPKRIFYALGSVFIPFVRFYRIVRNYSGCAGLLRTKPQVFPIMAAGLVASSIGEMTGYLTGAGDSIQKTLEYHFHRDQHVKNKD